VSGTAFGWLRSRVNQEQGHLIDLGAGVSGTAFGWLMGMVNEEQRHSVDSGAGGFRIRSFCRPGAGGFGTGTITRFWSRKFRNRGIEGLPTRVSEQY